MKKIHMIAALLAMLLPTTLLANSYNYTISCNVSTTGTGSGSVYVSNDGKFTGSSNDNGDDVTKTFTITATPDPGNEFSGWTVTGGTVKDSSAQSTTVSVTATKNATTPAASCVANFTKMTLPSFSITFETSSAGTYTVDGVAPANKTGLTEATSVKLQSTDPNFLSWNVGGTTISDNPYTATCIAATTISANFLTADQVTTATRYEELTAALANAQYVKITIPSGKGITVAKGATLTVPSGKQLVVDGMLWVEGTLAATGSVVANGKVSKCLKEITQTGDNGKPFNPYGSVKYWKTSSATSSASITGFTGFKTHALIVGGTGTQYRPEITSSSKLIIAVPDSTVAVNHIKSIGSVSTSVNVVNDTLNSGMVILLGNDCVINGGLTAKTGFRGVVDCAGNNCSTVSGVEVSGYNGKATFLNCPSFTGSKVVGITHDYFNCSSVTLSSYNAGGSSNLSFYDCGTRNSAASFSASYSKGPGDSAFVYFYSGYYNSFSYKTGYKVYGGAYKSDPAKYIADQDGFESVYDSSSKYYFVQEKVNVVNVVSINGTEYATLSDAISAASNGATISLIEAVDLEGGSVTIPAGKNVTIAVDKHTISGGKIVNNGTLLITDATVENEGKIACDIENNGTLDSVFGTYSGAIVNKAGTLTTHNGVFSGTLTMQGGMVALKGGHFTADVSDLVTAEGYHVVKDSDGRFCVCEFPDGTMRPTTVSSAAGYGATPYSDADFTVLYTRVKNGKTERKDYSAEDWMRLAELLCFYQVFYNNGLDATLAFDRDVAKGSINLLAKSTISTSVDFKFDLPAGELYRALSETVVGTYGFYAKTYYSLIDENIKSVAMAVTDKSGNNNGTVCTAMVELWESVRAPDYHDPDNKHMLTNTVLIVGEKRFTIGAGANKAMIRPKVGAATFYATVSAALAAVEDGGTVMLANDSADDVVFAKVGTYTIDANGFAFSGSVTATEGFTVASQGEGVYVVTSNPAAKIDVETVVSQVVSDEWLEANEISTEGKTEEEVQAAVQEVLNEKDDNGNAKWENLVIGQKADEKAAVTAANGGDDKTANIEVTFEVPKDKTTGEKIETGYTVKYAFDKVDETVEGGVVKGEAKDKPTLDIESVTAKDGPAYFKMRAVLEASDDSNVTAEVPVEKTIGVVKVASNAEITIIPVPWQSLGDGDIKAFELVHAASLSDDDELIVYGTDGKPQTWIVKNGEWTAPAAEYTIGGGDSEPQQVEAQDPAELKRGQGVILKRKDTKKEIVLIGQPVANETEKVETPIAAASANEPSWNLVASPKMAEVDISAAFTEEKGNTSDEIIVPTAGTPKHYTYKEGKWGYTGKISEKTVRLPNGKTTTAVQFGRKTGDTDVPAGTGFWYLNKDTSNDKKIAW